MDLVLPEPSMTLAEGAIAPWNPISSQYYPELLAQAAKTFKVRMDVPFNKLTHRERNVVLNGAKASYSIFIMKMTLAVYAMLMCLLKGC